MRITYLAQYFKPPNEAGSKRAYWVASHLVSRGYDVTVITQRNISYGDTGNEIPLISEVSIDGIRVVYLRNSYSNSMGLLARAVSFLRFMLLAIYAMLKSHPPDLIYASSTPLTVVVPALISKWLRGGKYIFEVRDLWPRVPIEMGGISSLTIQKVLLRLERLAYDQASAVVALSAGMRDGILRVAPTTDVRIVPNMSSLQDFAPPLPVADGNVRRGEHSKFRVIYFGQFGKSNDMPTVMEAAASLMECDPNVIVSFVGEGYYKEDIKSLCATNDRLEFSERVGIAELAKLLHSSDLSLVTFSDFPILATNSPNKLFDSLAAGLPIIVNTDGWMRELVENNGCGFYCEVGNAEALVQTILNAKQDSISLDLSSKKAREVAGTQFSKEFLCNQIATVVADTLAGTT